MLDLEKLQEMAKNGEISKKLLEDENFKMELKKILKEESGLEITDEQIPEILKNFENALQDEEVLKEAKLENISGGTVKEMSDEQYKKYKYFKNKHKRIRSVTSFAGLVLGAVCTIPSTRRAGNEAINKMKNAIQNEEYGTFAKEFGFYTSNWAAEAAAIYGIEVLSAKLGDLIADKILERDLKKMNVN